MRHKTAEVCICIPSFPETPSESSLTSTDQDEFCYNYDNNDIRDEHESYDYKCHICWEEEASETNPIINVDCCPHVTYHKSCLVKWLDSCQTCPFCRNVVKHHSALSDEEKMRHTTLSTTPTSIQTTTIDIEVDIQQPMTSANDATDAVSLSHFRRYINTINMLRCVTYTMSINFVGMSCYYIVTACLN